MKSLPSSCGYMNQPQKVSFRSTLDEPFKIRSQGISLRDGPGLKDWVLVDCRHGRALFEHWKQHQCVVCDPVTTERYILDVPLAFHNQNIFYRHWAVLCEDDNEGHVHGSCHESPLKVVLVATYQHEHKYFIITSVYSQKTASRDRKSVV